MLKLSCFLRTYTRGVWLFILLSLCNFGQGRAAQIDIKFRRMDDARIVIYGKTDSLIVGQKEALAEKLNETKSFLLNIIGNQPDDVKALQRAVGLSDSVADGDLGTATLRRLFAKIKNLDIQKPITLVDPTTNTKYILSLKEIPKEKKTVDTTAVGWFVNGQLLRIGYVQSLGKEVDSLRFSYFPPRGLKVDTLSFQSQEKVWLALRQDTAKSELILIKADSFIKASFDSLLVGSSLNLQAEVRTLSTGARADSTIVADFCLLPDNQIALLVRQPSLVKTPDEAESWFRRTIRTTSKWFNSAIVKWKNWPLEGQVVSVLTLIALIGFVGYFRYKARARRTVTVGEREMQYRITQEWFKNFQERCPDLFIKPAPSEQPQEETSASSKGKSSKKQLKAAYKAAEEGEIQAAHSESFEPNLTALKGEIVNLIMTAWNARKAELAETLVEDEHQEKFISGPYDELLYRVDGLRRYLEQIRQQALELLQTRPFLFGEVKADKQRALETLNERLGGFENTLQALQAQVGNGHFTWDAVVGTIQSHLKTGKNAEQKLQEISNVVPPIFAPPQDQSASSAGSPTERNGHDLLGLLTALERWSNNYNRKRRQEFGEDLDKKIQDLLLQHYLLYGINEVEEELGRSQSYLSGKLMTQEEIRKRALAFRESKNLKTNMEEFEKAVINEVSRYPAKEQFQPLLQFLQIRFNELKQILVKQPDLAEIHKKLVTMFYALSEYYHELKSQRDSLVQWQSRLEELRTGLAQASGLKQALDQKAVSLQSSIDALCVTDKNLSGAVEQLSSERLAYERAKQQYEAYKKALEEKWNTDLGKEINIRESKLREKYAKEKEDLEKQINQWQEKLTAQQTAWETEKTQIRKDHHAELQKLKSELDNRLGILNQAVSNAITIENSFRKAEKELHDRIAELQDDLAKRDAERPVQSQLEAEFKSVKKDLANYHEFIRLPYSLHMARELFLAMTPLFDGRLQGLAEASYSSLNDEYKKLRNFFDVLATKLRLDLDSSNPAHINDLRAALLECESKRKEFIKNFVLVLVTPFYRSYQLAYHISQTQNDLRKAIIQNYYRFKAITAELGVHLHDIIIFETRPDGNFHEAIGIGCTTPVLQDIYNHLRQKGFLPAPCITDVLRIGFESTVEGIESERSVVRTSNG